MWCGFCGAYAPEATSEECDCSPAPLAEQQLPELGQE